MLGRLRNRFQWLGGGARDLPERQRTLRHAIDWSYDLLTPAEKILMQRLSVFVGGATVDAVEAICAGEGDTLDLLTTLADKSLLQRQEDHDGNVRIRMLETIREYARERLGHEGDPAQVRARQAMYYLALAEAPDGVTVWLLNKFQKSISSSRWSVVLENNVMLAIGASDAASCLYV